MDVMTTLRGTGVAIVTPFSKDESLDLEAFGKLIDHIITGGCEYIVVLGTTGETPVLSKEEKVELVQFSTSHIAGRVPLVIGIGGNNTKAVAQEFESLPLESATAILSASPFYNKPSQEGLFQHYRYLSEASPKPLLLYNVPGRTGRNLSAATTLRLANEFENIVGVKEASGDMLQCMQILRDRPKNFLVVSGDDALALPQMSCGMDGVISVAANSFPAEFSDMIRFCLSGDFDSARKINDQLMDAYQLMFEENNPAGIKAFLHEQNILENVCRLPVVPLSGVLHQSVKKFMNIFNPAVGT